MLVLATILLPIVTVLLKRRGFRRTERILARVSKAPGEPGDPNSKFRARRAARMVSIAAARGLYSPRCLEQAVTLWWMLGLMRIDTSIRLGIYKKDDQVEAHAWVIHEDEIIIGQIQGLEDYVPILDVSVNRPTGDTES